MNVVLNMMIQCKVLFDSTLSGKFQKNLDFIKTITSESKGSIYVL